MGKNKVLTRIIIELTKEDTERIFNREPLRTLEEIMVNTDWYQEELDFCIREYFIEKAYLGGYLEEWGIPQNLRDDYAVEYITHYVRAATYSVAVSLNIKENLEISLTLERLIQDKEFILEKILEAGEALKNNVRGDIELMLKDNRFSENNKVAQAS